MFNRLTRYVGWVALAVALVVAYFAIYALPPDVVAKGITKFRGDVAFAQDVQMLNGNRIDLDSDNDTSIRASADDTVVIEVAGADDFTILANSFELVSGSIVDLNGSADALVLDADADTSIAADTDDQIDIELSSADDFRFTANDFTALSGSALSTDLISETTSGNGINVDGVHILDTTVDLQGTADALILDADNDTTISAPTDDQIDFELSGADDFRMTANTFTVLAGSKVDHTSATGTRGIVFATSGAVAYTDTGGVAIGAIPANANIVDAMVAVTTAFNDTGTDLLDCGDNSGSSNELFSAIPVTGTGISRTTAQAGLGDVGASIETIRCVYTGSNADSSAGAATVIVWWIVD